MQSIAELLKKTHDFFLSKEIPEARYHAERLLADCLQSDRLSIYLNLEKIADDHLIVNYRQRIQQFLNSSEKKNLLSKCLADLKTQFSENNIPEGDLHAEEIIAHVLQTSRAELKLMNDQELATDQLEFIKEFANRRLKREPLQYILGYTEFYGYPIRLNKNVLIPRPETEILVEKTLGLIHNKTNLQVLDIGCGSGCISIALKKERPDLKLTAIDFSEQAILQAEKNAGKNDASIQFIQVDFLKTENWNLLENFDLIISNPPYVSQNELSDLEKELRFEPQAALSDFSDGFTFYRAIAKFAETHLNEHGLVALEIGHNQSAEIQQIFSNWQTSSIKDYNQLDRIIIAQKN